MWAFNQDGRPAIGILRAFMSDVCIVRIARITPDACKYPRKKELLQLLQDIARLCTEIIGCHDLYLQKRDERDVEVWYKKLKKDEQIIMSSSRHAEGIE